MTGKTALYLLQSSQSAHTQRRTEHFLWPTAVIVDICESAKNPKLSNSPLFSLLTSQIRIRVGEYDFSHIQEEFPYVEKAIARKVVHPKYNFFTYEFDLALVKLESSLEFAQHIAPICLPGTDDLLIGRNATG